MYTYVYIIIVHLCSDTYSDTCVYMYMYIYRPHAGRQTERVYIQ